MKAPPDVLSRGTDYTAGWEIGRNEGRERVGSKLYDRQPPEHLVIERRWNWQDGYKAGLLARTQAARVMVAYTDPAGVFQVVHMTGSNRDIVNRLARSGVAGDVEITRARCVHRCGI